jgi:hypothetical protein
MKGRNKTTTTSSYYNAFHYVRKVARYAKGMAAINCPSDDGYKTRAALLIEHLNPRYSGRENSYILSEFKADTFEVAVRAYKRIHNGPLCDIGQLSAIEKRGLVLLQGMGWIEKGLGGPYPALKTTYAVSGFDFAADRQREINLHKQRRNL